MGRWAGLAYIIGHSELENFPKGVDRILTPDWIILSVSDVVVGREEYLIRQPTLVSPTS